MFLAALTGGLELKWVLAEAFPMVHWGPLPWWEGWSWSWLWTGGCVEEVLVVWTRTPDTFQSATSVVGLRASEFVCKSFEIGISVPHRSLALLNLSLAHFQSWLWGLIFLVGVGPQGWGA